MGIFVIFACGGHHLINLTGNNDQWNTIKNKPVSLENIIEISINIDEKIDDVFFISPDFQNGDLISLERENIEMEHGKGIKIEVPVLHYWSLVVITLV